MNNQFGGIDWWCDKCGSPLNIQEGFSTTHKKWKCSECGHVNTISEKNIYKSKADYHKHMGIKKLIRFVIFVFILVALVYAGIYYFPILLKQSTEQTAEVVEETIIGEEGKVTTISENNLTDVIKTSKLYTAAYPYNGYCAVYKEDSDKEEVKYYVSYEGTVKAGIDVSKIEVELDEDTNTITIKLPEVTVEKPTIDAGTMEYIFVKKKYNTETVAQEAYKKALEDLEQKVNNDDNIIISATESAKAAEKALVEPWVNQVSSEEQYTVKVVGYGEE
ncbi:Protein of unknown function [Pseudobutyrivibrio sp. C4]|uniref:DUF4230 domain-containing protein n=1 Tax=Pseudobutyrivibrio sp. C4 TaxID=1520803 RepID=UPI0008AB662F|nr:DUF4230 domain-containing protein [Pseudobutyrivibrio sp. C4]SES65313.1 Protein of unknown function [Pseudobutyrivibrio sp. C4]